MSPPRLSDLYNPRRRHGRKWQRSVTRDYPVRPLHVVSGRVPRVNLHNSHLNQSDDASGIVRDQILPDLRFFLNPYTPECLAFSEAVAGVMVRSNPELYTTTFAKRGRESKILIDYMRNNRTNTSIRHKPYIEEVTADWN
jgi:LigD-like primase-polymerase